MRSLALCPRPLAEPVHQAKASEHTGISTVLRYLYVCVLLSVAQSGPSTEEEHKGAWHVNSAAPVVHHHRARDRDVEAVASDRGDGDSRVARLHHIARKPIVLGTKNLQSPEITNTRKARRQCDTSSSASARGGGDHT